MGTIQVPGRISGRTYTIDIKGDTPSETEQARIRAFLEDRESQFAADYEARYGAPLAVEDGVALGRGWELGKAGAYSRLGTATEYLGRGLGLESLVGTGQRMREEGDYEAFLESLRQPAPTTLQDVTGIGSALTYLGEGIGQSGPEMLAPLAATGIGTLVGTAATGNPFTGGAIGLGAGAVTAFPSFFGGNIQRQEAEVAAGRKDEVDVTNAIVGAVGQSALNAIGDKLLLGGFLKPGQKWLTRTAVGGVEGAATEIPTEIAQQIIERKQAGLPLDSDEAINEYINAGILGGIMGGGVRATTAGLGIGMERPAAPGATPPAAPPTRPPLPTLGEGQEQGELFDDLPEQAVPSATVGAETDQQAAPAPSTERQLEMFAPEDEGRPTGGVSIDEDLADARMVYDERLAIAEEGGADPEEAKRIAAQAAVNYVDSLEEATRNRLVRFRNTMARMATGPTRGVMPPDLPDSAYASEFGETAQKDLFAPSPAAPAPRPGSYEAAVADGLPPVPPEKLRPKPAETRPVAPAMKPGPAVWASADFDIPVEVADAAPQAGPDGRFYQQVIDPITKQPSFVPLDELRQAGPSPVKAQPPAEPQQREALIGTDAGNGFLHGLGGERYRVSESSAYRGQSSPAVALEKRFSSGTAATFLVGNDGKLIDADTIALNRPEQRERIWTTNDAQKRAQVATLLKKAAQLPLGTPERKALLDQIREIVTGSGGSPQAAPKAPAAPATAASQFSERDIRHEMDGILLFEGPRSTEEELRKDAIANLQRRAGAPADQEPIFGEEWMEAARKQLPQDKSTGPLILDPFKNSPDPGSAGLSFMFGKSRPATPEGAQDDTTTAETQSETVGAGVESRGRGVEQRKPDTDVQPAEGVEAPAERRLGRSVSVSVGPDTAAGAEPDTLTESGLPSDPDKPSLPDTRGMGVRFHGSTSEITQVEDGYVGSDRNFYGQGFYTSDAVAITDGYSKAKGAKDGAVYRVDEIGPVNALDMEQPVPDWLISDYEAGRSQAALNDDLVAAAIEDMQAEGKALNLREFYDLIRDMSPEFNLPTYEVQEYFDSLSQIIMARGFNALDHIGGLRTKKAPHSVRIYLAPQNTVRITKVDPKNPDMTPSAELPKAAVAAPAARAEPDPLAQLEERLAAARARAAELRNKVPAGVLQRELVGGKVDPALAKQVANLQNILAREQKAAESAQAKFERTKVPGATRDGRLQALETALAKVKDTQAKLAAAQDALGAAELAAGLRRGAEPKAPMTDKNKAAYTAYFNALQDADTLRQTLESERARRTPAPETPPTLPTGLRGDILPELNVVYPSGGTAGLGRVVPPLKEPVNPEAPLTMLGRRKVLPPASVTWKVAEDVRKANIRERFSKFFAENASPALVRYTTARGGFNNEATWKNFPDWMSAGDQLRVLQLLGRPTREQRTKYNISEEESPRLTDEESAARTYFAKMLRPVDAIDMMLADLSVYYASYKSAPGQTDAGLQALLLGTGSDPAKLALNWVRANLSPETNKQIDLILKKQAEKDAVTADWVGTEGTDRVAGGRTARDAARKARKAAAEESGYDAGSIIRRMLLTDPVASLDQDMHYSVKAALDVGDLRGALLSLSATTRSSELRMLAERFAYLVGTTRVRVIYPGDSRKYIGSVPNSIAMYVQLPPGVDPEYENTILIDGQLGMTNHVLMHEVAHAVTARLINDSPNHPTVRQLEELLDILREKGPKPLEYDADGNPVYSDEFYGLTSVGEMVAEVYGRVAFGAVDSGLLDLMKRTRIETEPTPYAEDVPLNAWERFKEIVGNLFRMIVGRPTKRYPRRTRIAFEENYTTARDEFHRLVDGLLSTAPQVLPDSVLQDAVVNPMVARNVLNNAVNNAQQWSPEGAKRLGELMVSSVPKPLRRALLGLLQLDWFNDFAGKYFPQIAELKAVDDLRRGKYQRLIKAAAPAIKRLINYAKKNPELYKKLVAIQGQATLSKVDPTRPVSDYAGDKEKTAEWYNLDRQLNVDSTGELRKLFKETRNVFAQFREEIKRVLKVRALEITNDQARANSLVARLLQKLDEENAIDPYFSLMRQGDFWLTYTAEDTTAEPVAVGPLGQMKRPTTQYVQAFETPFARDKFRAKLEAAKDANGDPIAWDIESKPRPKNEYNRGGTASIAFAQGALNIISGFGGQGATDAEKKKVDDAVNAIQELFVRLTPDHSAMKAFINRKGTRGFMGDITPLGVVDTPTDFVEALARKVEGLSHQLVNIEFGGKIQKLIESSGETYKKLQENGQLTEGEQAAVDAYHDEFVERAGLAKNPSVGALAQFARGTTFGWTLGFNIAGGLNNIVQLAMVGMPELAGRYGLGASKRELGFAMRAMANAGKTEKVLSFGPDGREVRELSGVDNFGSLGNYFEPVITVDPKTKEEVITLRLRTDKKIPAKLKDKIANMDVLAEVMANNGMLNASMSQEMLESERGWLQKINRWSGFLQHHAERFNRQAMAIAAYNLELGNIKGPISQQAKLAAAKKAIEITERVNGTIGASTAPRYAMNAFGSVVFMFKRFALHMTRYIINTTLQALKKIDPSMSAAQIEEAKKERAVARYQITGMLGATALFAGVQGLPFFSELMTLINLFFTDDDEERPEVLVQKFLGEPYYHGALNYLLGIDVASRISMSGLIFRENKIEKDQSVMYDTIEMFGGPAVGVFQNIERGVKLINDGEFYRGVEAMSPAAVKSILKSFRFSTDGATTLRGDEIVPLTPMDIVRQGLGYTPGVYARTQERVSGAKRIDEAIREKKRKLLRKFNTAYREGDFSTVRDVLKEMQEFSRKYPEDAITPDTVERSRRSFEQRSQEMISGVSFTNSGRTRAEKSFEEFDEDVTLWASLAN